VSGTRTANYLISAKRCGCCELSTHYKIWVKYEIEEKEKRGKGFRFLAPIGGIGPKRNPPPKLPKATVDPIR
jgi:hypothetical protein